MSLTVYPVIRFNSAGSNTNSGAGPDTAITGTGGVTDGTTTVDLSADTPSLGSVATDGSAVLYIQTSSGTRHSRINTVNAGAYTMVVEDTLTTGSGLTWSIGGKKDTPADSQATRLWDNTSGDAKDGWIMEFEEDFTIAGAASGSAIIYVNTNNVYLIFRGKSGAKRTLTNSNNGSCFTLSGGFTRLQNMKLANSNGTKTSANGVVVSSNKEYWIEDCILGDSTNTLYSGIYNSSSGAVNVLDSYIVDTTNTAILFGANSSTLRLLASHIESAGNYGLYFNGNSYVTIISSIIANSTSAGMFTKSSGNLLTIHDSTISNNGGDGIELNNSAGQLFVITGNNITGNSGHGIDASADTSGTKHQVLLNNNFGTGGDTYGGANSSGSYTGLAQNATINGNLTVDPGYSAAASGNFEGGANVTDVGFPSGDSGAIAAGQSGTTYHKDIGVEQDEAAGGGGGTTVPQGIHPIGSGITA